MKQALTNLLNIVAIPLMTVLVSSLTVYGAMGIDPFTQHPPQVQQASR